MCVFRLLNVRRQFFYILITTGTERRWKPAPVASDSCTPDKPMWTREQKKKTSGLLSVNIYSSYFNMFSWYCADLVWSSSTETVTQHQSVTYFNWQSGLFDHVTVQIDEEQLIEKYIHVCWIDFYGVCVYKKCKVFWIHLAWDLRLHNFRSRTFWRMFSPTLRPRLSSAP